MTISTTAKFLSCVLAVTVFLVTPATSQQVQVDLYQSKGFGYPMYRVKMNPGECKDLVTAVKGVNLDNWASSIGFTPQNGKCLRAYWISGCPENDKGLVINKNRSDLGQLDKRISSVKTVQCK